MAVHGTDEMEDKKKAWLLTRLCSMSCFGPSGFVLFLVEFPVLLTEFVNPTGSVNKLRLARVERMTFVAHFHFHQRIFVAVFPLDGLFGFSRRFAQKRVLVAHVLEHDQSVVVGMDAFFHLFQFWVGKDTKTHENCTTPRHKNLGANGFDVFHNFEGMISVESICANDSASVIWSC